MAIKFVDVESEDGQPKKDGAATAKPQTESDASEPATVFKLPHAKPAPKKRGRK